MAPLLDDVGVSPQSRFFAVSEFRDVDMDLGFCDKLNDDEGDLGEPNVIRWLALVYSFAGVRARSEIYNKIS